jgi:hypothetical protein
VRAPNVHGHGAAVHEANLGEGEGVVGEGQAREKQERGK